MPADALPPVQACFSPNLTDFPGLRLLVTVSQGDLALKIGPENRRTEVS
jgi:hypothetical protein